MMLVKDLAPSWHVTEGLLSHSSRSAVGRTTEHPPHARVLPKLPWEVPPISISRGLDKTQWPVNREGQRSKDEINGIIYRSITNIDPFLAHRGLARCYPEPLQVRTEGMPTATLEAGTILPPFNR